MLDRRAFLLSGLTAYGASARALFAGGAVLQSPKFPTSPFTLGVCSGDPAPDGVVLWTRLAIDPLNGGGMPRQPVEVQWQVAADDRLSKIVRSGKAIASPEWGHAVHVEVSGLQPHRWYWYQFRVGTELSPIGRTRTFPAPGSAVDRLRPEGSTNVDKSTCKPMSTKKSGTNSSESGTRSSRSLLPRLWSEFLRHTGRATREEAAAVRVLPSENSAAMLVFDIGCASMAQFDRGSWRKAWDPLNGIFGTSFWRF